MRYVIGLLASLMLAGPAAAQTSFYKCTDEKGRTVFSDRKCGSDAEAASVAPTKAGREADDDAATWDRITADRQVRDMERDIKRKEQRISELERERDRKIAALRNKKSYANNNLAGATWEESISSEMMVITDQYSAKIDREMRDIERMEDKIDRLRE